MHHWLHQQSCRLVNLWGIWPWLDWLSKSDNCNCWTTEKGKRENFMNINMSLWWVLNLFLKICTWFHVYTEIWEFCTELTIILSYAIMLCSLQGHFLTYTCTILSRGWFLLVNVGFVCKFVVKEEIISKGLTGNMAIGPVGRNLCHATLLSDVWKKL